MADVRRRRRRARPASRSPASSRSPRTTCRRHFRRIDTSQAPKVILLDAGDRLVSAFSEKLSAQGRRGARRPGRDRAGGRAGHGDRRAGRHDRGRRRHRADRQPHGDLGGRRARGPAHRRARPGHGRDHRPRRPHRGQPRPHGAGASGDLGDRRRRVAARARTASRSRGWPPSRSSRPITSRRGSARAGPEPSTPFRYLDKGALAVVGRGQAVCEIRGHELWGRPAFFTYLAVHLYYLGGQVGPPRRGAHQVDRRPLRRAPERADRGRARERRAAPGPGAGDALSGPAGAVVGAHLLPLAADLGAARSQMAFTLGFHIVLASLGVALPGDDADRQLPRAAARRRRRAAARAALVEGRGRDVRRRRGDGDRPVVRDRACCGPSSRAASARSSACLFALEGIFFFLEAIFIAIYIFGWKRPLAVDALLDRGARS